MMESADIEVVLRRREKSIGAFNVGRVLPSLARRAVGPFVFFDHMGPLDLSPGAAADVLPHPHIGLATVTYLFEGAIEHRDSLGTHQLITPGAINWMTAGRGIVHSERMTAKARAEGTRLHGLQLWVALPSERAEMAPEFQHCEAEALPVLEREGARLRLLAGKAFGLSSPVRTLSPLFYIETQLEKMATLPLPAEYRDRAVYVIEGGIFCEIGATDTLPARHEAFGPGELIVLRPGASPVLRATVDARVMLLGGEGLGHRDIWWNFVAGSKERIEQAKRDWKEGRFGRVPGDEHEFIPLPE